MLFNWTARNKKKTQKICVTDGTRIIKDEIQNEEVIEVAICSNGGDTGDTGDININTMNGDQDINAPATVGKKCKNMHMNGDWIKGENVSNTQEFYKAADIEKYQTAQMLRDMNEDYIIRLDLGCNAGNTDILIPASLSTSTAAVQAAPSGIGSTNKPITNPPTFTGTTMTSNAHTDTIETDTTATVDSEYISYARCAR